VAQNPAMDWAAAYAGEEARVLRALGEGVAGIEHVGSTAVAGLPARPILDVLVGLVDAEPSAEHLRALRSIGYGPPTRRCGRMYVVRGRPRQVTLHLAQWGGLRWFRMLDFRDALRADPSLARRYAELKRVAAAGGPADYAEAKRRFVEAQLRRLAR
jgi:GrpB-like predicted nucleotidyltransferase (UPF0157 family)